MGSWNLNVGDQSTNTPTIPLNNEEETSKSSTSGWNLGVELKQTTETSPETTATEVEAEPTPLATDTIIEEYGVIARQAEAEEEALPQVLATDLIDAEIAQEDLYDNELNPDMYYTQTDFEAFAGSEAPFLQQAYLDMLKEERKADPKSPYLNGEIARLEQEGWAIPEYEDDPSTTIDESDLFDRIENNLPINDNRFPPIFVEKFVKEFNRRNTPEEIKFARESAEMQYQEYKNTLEPRALEQAKEAGFDDIESWVASLPEDRQERWNSQPRTRQEFFDRIIEKSDDNIRGSMMMAYSMLNAESPVMRKAAELIMMSDDFNLSGGNFAVMLQEIVNPASAIGDMSVDAARFSRQTYGAWSKFMEIFDEAKKVDPSDERTLGQYLGGMAGAAFWTTLDTASLIPGVNFAKARVKGAKNWLDNPIYNKARNARRAGEKREIELRAALRNKVKDNPNVEQEIFDDLEARGLVIYTEKDGKKVLDREKLREAGLKKTREIMTGELVDADGNSVIANIPEDALTVPILDAKSLDGIISTLIDLRKIAPKEFTRKGERSIDAMVRVVLERKVEPTRMMQVLADNGLTFEEFVVGTFGSVSKAGEVLGTFGAIKRFKPKKLLDEIDSAVKIKQENVFFDLYNRYFLRSEAIAKGALVAPIAVAARNVASAVSRAPLEVLNGVLSNAMLEFSRKGIKDGSKALIPYTNNSIWKGSLDPLKYMFSDPRSAKHFSEYILEQSPDHMKLIYNTLNEIQLNLGRGRASKRNNPIAAADRVFDTMMSDAEDMVAMLNMPNRIQELGIRNATFYSELKRLVKREYNVDFEQALEEGKLMDFFRDSTSVRPENAPSFVNLLDQAANKSLRVTYSAAPDNVVLRKTAEFISKSPATILMPFPRFVANGFEYFAEMGGVGFIATGGLPIGGAVKPLARKAYSLFDRSVRGPLTARETEQIANNMIGVGIFMGLTDLYDRMAPERIIEEESDEELRNQRSENYKKFRVPFTDLEMDITADYPIGQMSWIIQATRERNRGTFDQWDAKKDWLQLFVGAQGRTGVTNILVEEFTNLIGDVDSDADEAKLDQIIGRALGSYATRFANPLFQIVEAERKMGFRTTERKEARQDFLITDNNMQVGITRQARSRGLMDPDAEEALMQKQTITNTGETRDNIMWRLLAGRALNDRNATLNFFSSIGIDDPNYTLGSKHKMISVQTYQNEKVSEKMPLFMDLARTAGARARKRWNQDEGLQEAYSEPEYVRIYMRDSIRNNIDKYRSKIGEGKGMLTNRLETRVDQYMQLSKDRRRMAEADFIRMKDREVDYGNYKDLEILLTYAGVNVKKRR